jgi:uncharacterized protein (DUF58 family)
MITLLLASVLLVSGILLYALRRKAGLLWIVAFILVILSALGAFVLGVNFGRESERSRVAIRARQISTAVEAVRLRSGKADGGVKLFYEKLPDVLIDDNAHVTLLEALDAI